MKELGKWAPTPPGVEFWRTKISFYPAGHRKQPNNKRAGFAGPSFVGVRMKFLKKKTRILARLLDEIEPGLFRSDQP